MNDPSLGPTPAPGDPIGPYQLESVLGAGGMATVYRARDERGAPVAIKVLNPARVPPEEVKRFTREYKALASMDHANVVAVYGTGVHEGYPWIAMEYVDGSDLGALIDQWKASPPPDRYARAERIVRELCHGLQYVHDLGLVHRDIKPGNILLTRDEHPKISDFGVVTSGGDSGTAGFTQLTMAGRLVGTVAFMAPEVITAEDVDRRADLYALGAVLYQLCTGKRPIEADSVAGYLARHLTEVPKPLTDHDPSAPPHLSRVCQRLLLKDRVWRYPTATAVLQALDARDAPERPPLRGRDDLLTRWNQRARQLDAGGGGLLLLTGPPGSGRTHTLQQLADLARSMGWRVLEARAATTPLVEQLARSAGVEPRWGALDAASGDGPQLLSVDDLDRADPDEIGALARLVRNQVVLEARPLLLLASAADTEGRLATLASGESTGVVSERWHLEPLDQRAVTAMLRDRGVTGRSAPVLARRLFDDYRGQPGGIVQQLDAMVQTGWFEADEGALKPLRSAEDLRRADLPVPYAIQAELEVRLNALDRPATELVELLALLDRPASASLLSRCVASLPERVPGLLASLERDGVAARAETEDGETFELAHPCAGRVLRARMTALARRERHARIAEALSVRRRQLNALEVARHLHQAGQDAAALPLYLQAAKAAARGGASSLVLEITEEAAQLAPSDAADPDASRSRRWLTVLRGEALLARGRWDHAVEVLDQGLAQARVEGEPEAVGRALASLGRAHYRAGALDRAEPLLVEALQRSPDDAAVRAPATRALADIRLRAGRIAESEALWERALDLAIDQGSRDGEARARRGLAHLRCVQGRLEDTATLLDQADELLDHPDGDARVRAGVLARAVEIETCSGRYGAALRRCETLVELVRQRDLTERLPEAYALLAETLVALGDPNGAHDAAHQSLVFARAHGPSAWDARLRASRALADLDRWSEVEGALPEPEVLPNRPVDDPAAQLAALRARLYTRTHAGKAADQAMWALVRPPPLLAIRAVRIAIDASLALSRLGQTDAARGAVKRGLKALDGPGADGLRLELLLAMQRARPDVRVVRAMRQIASRIVDALSPEQAAAFMAREGVEEALFG